MIPLTARIGHDGYPIALLRMRRARAQATDEFIQQWAIIDTAAANSFFDESLLTELNVNIPSVPGRTVKYVTATGERGEVPAYNVSFWIPGEGEAPDKKLLDGFEIGGERPRVQRVLLGMDFLRRFELRIDGPKGTVELVLP